jgi:DNA repair protein RadC
MNPENNPNLSIKQWAEDDRPREKLLLKGRTSLSDAELIAVLIATGTREESAVDLAKRILLLARNNLNLLGKISVRELQKINGIGSAKATCIVAALELGRRRKDEAPLSRKKISSSADTFTLLGPLLSDLPVEEFWVLLLNRANKLLDYKRISEGGVSGTIVDTKVIFKYALEHLASSIILCHNHPSGNTEPSEADKQLTKNIRTAASVLQISLIDHLIIGHGNYFSFADDGIL